MNHFLSIADFTSEQIGAMLVRAHGLRAQRARGEANEPVLAGKTLAMLFEKPSLRTRVSFEQGMYELGGRAIVLGREEIGLGKRESVADVARVLGGMVQGIAARVFAHEHLEALAEHAGVPVINMLSDRSHPAQALADVLTLMDEFSPGSPEGLAGRTVAFVGDGNNVARSLAVVCEKLGMRFVIASPKGYELSGEGFERVMDPKEAVAGADAVYADTFVSMGEEGDKEQKLAAFADYQINDALLEGAAGHAVVLHCLPAYRGVEITDAVMDGARSRVFAQAHNRLHAQKGMLAGLLGAESEKCEVTSVK